MPTKCKGCDTLFEKKSGRQLFCSVKCRETTKKIGKPEKIKKCIVCGNDFHYRAIHEVVCGKECRKEHARLSYYDRNRIEKITECQFCGKNLKNRRGNTRFCSRSCAKKAERQRMPLIEKKCSCCGEIFFTKNKETQFCGSSCSNKISKKHDDLIKQCENCGEDFTTTYIRRDKRFCSKACANTGEFNSMYGMTGSLSPTYGKTPWTKGKSAETDERIAALGKKISSVLRQKYAAGEMSNSGINNPMYGRKHSDEACNKMSDTRAEKILNGEYASWFKKGSHFSPKLQEEIIYRSSWELSAYKHLDEDENVTSYSVEPFRIKYEDPDNLNKTRNYIPDILIEYRDGTRKLVEIKPEVFVDHPTNQNKFVAAKDYCEKNDIIFEVWTEGNIFALSS